ncbi:hypothetical protein [Acetobacter orleanensis]|nr:hypothetical protein [Acetobacter orleanensis]GBR30097.1 hypothetical protein AA0473_2184 [Acetobacter orleanensis NRIC 0473]
MKYITCSILFSFFAYSASYGSEISFKNRRIAGNEKSTNHLFSNKITKPVIITASEKLPYIQHRVKNNLSILDNSNMSNMGADIDTTTGTYSANDIQNLLNQATYPVLFTLRNGEHYPVKSDGSAITSIPDAAFNNVYLKADGQFLTSSMEKSGSAPSWNGGHLADKVGDTVLVEDFEQKFGIMRDRKYISSNIFDYLTYRMPAPITSDFYTLDASFETPPQCGSAKSSGYNEYWCNRINWGSSVHKNTVNSSSNTGITIHYNNMHSTGFGYGGAFDVINFNDLHEAGTNWGWVDVHEFDEDGNLSAGGYSLDGNFYESGLQHYIDEWDYSGVGPDNPDTSYNPFKSRRYGLWYNQWVSSAGGKTGGRWQAKTEYDAFRIIVQHNNKDNIDYMYEATVQGGKTGPFEPFWTFVEKHTVLDGTQKWVFLGKEKFQLGCFLCVGPSHKTEIGTLFAAYGNIYNAAFDFSQLSYVNNIHVLIRTKTDSYFDLSANGTASGQNNHLLGYGGGKDKSLKYIVFGKSIFSVEDDGNINIKGAMRSGKLIIPFGTPYSSNDTCTQGQMQIDSHYIYTCVATNSWHRTDNGSTW